MRLFTIMLLACATVLFLAVIVGRLDAICRSLPGCVVP
jgi:hypothetical protein